MSAALLVTAAIAYLLTRAPPDGSPPLVPEATDRDDATHTTAEHVTIASERRTRVPPPAAAVSAVADTAVLRVVLEGLPDDQARMTTVTVRVPVVEPHESGWTNDCHESWLCQGSTSEFGLDRFFATVTEQLEDLRVDRLVIDVDHPLHAVEERQLPLSNGVKQKSGQTIHEVRVRLTPAAVIHGRLMRDHGVPATKGFVGALRLEDSSWERPTTTGSTVIHVPVQGDGEAVECAPDGSFELRVRTPGRYALASHEAGRRPTTTRVRARLGTRVDAGTLILETGHAITGHVRRQGLPMAGAVVSLTWFRTFWAASPTDVENGMNRWILGWRTFKSPERSITFTWLDERFELLGMPARVDKHGAFAFHGLAPRDYPLRIIEVPGTQFLPHKWDNPAFGKEGPDEMVVRAPAHGVEMEFNWASIRFELRGDLERENQGRVVLKTKSLHRGNERTYMPEYQSAQFPLDGGERTLVFQAPSSQQILGEVSFPGRQLVPLDFRTPKPGGELVVPVELVRGDRAATLVIELEHPPAETPTTFTIILKRADQADAPEMLPVEVREGRLRIEGIVPGKYRVIVCAGGDSNHTGLFFRNELELELPAARVVTRSLTMRQGAGLRFTLRNEEGDLLGGRYEFFELTGNRVRLVMVDDTRWQPGSDAWATTGVFGPGTQKSSGPIRPGRYRLRLLSSGYAERTVTVDLRAGEYEEVEIALAN